MDDDHTMTKTPADQQVTDPATNQPSQDPEVSATDFDDEELARARAELAAEAPTENRPAEPAQPPVVAGVSQAAETNPALTSAPGPVSYERFLEVVQQRDQARQRAIYMEGVAAGMRQQTPPAETDQGAAAPPISTADKIVAARAPLLQATADYDDGKISYADLERVRMAAEDQVAELRNQAILDKIAESMPQRVAEPTISDEQVLNQQLEQLAREHPYLDKLGDNHFKFLEQMARQEAVASGKPIGTGPRETMRLREIVSNLSDHYGPKWFPGEQPATPSRSAPPVSPGARARAVGLAAAADHPPNVNGLGRPGGGFDISEASIMAMSEEDIAALPAATRARIMNQT